MDVYQVRLLDRNRNLLAILDHITGWRYSRRPSAATTFSVSIPRRVIEETIPQGSELYYFLSATQPTRAALAPGQQEPQKLEGAQIAALVEVWQIEPTPRRRVAGPIVGRKLGRTATTLECMTEEILLERSRTPAQYGRVWHGMDLADVARDLLRGWETLRVKDRSQWEAAVERVNVDTGTEPGIVMLAKDGSGRYQASGYIVLRFRAAEVPGFTSWDRIRWLSDYGGPVRTTMQYRTGTNPSSMGPWSSEIVGALADEIGVVPSSTSAAIIDVRINLYTDDRESEDAEGNPVGQTPALYAVEVIARTQPILAAGSIPASTGVVVTDIEADNATALKVLQDACAQAGWEFEVEGGELHLAPQIGEDRTNQFVLRSGTNMDIDTLGDDDDELVNVLTAYGPGDGINRLMTVKRDPESIAVYGEYPGTVTFDDVSTLAELETAAEEYLASHNVPKQSFRVRAVFTPEEEPMFRAGDVVRVVDPDSGVVTVSRIVEESRSFSTGGVTIKLDMGKGRSRLIDAALGTRQRVRELAPPTGFHHVFDQGILFLRWQPGDADRWEVWWTQETDEQGQPIRFVQIATVGQPRYEHEGLEIGSGNWYMLYARQGQRRSEAAGPYYVVARDVTAPATPAAPSVRPAIRGLIIDVVTPNVERDLAGYEVHVSTTSGFTPGTDTLKATLAATPGQKARLDVVDLTPGTTYYVKLKAFDTSGNVSAASAQVSAVAGYHHIHDSDAVRNVLSYTYADSLDANHKLDCVFYMPPKTLAIRSAKVYVKGQPYRAYSLQAAYFDAFGTPTTSVGVPHSHIISTTTGTTSSSGRHSHTYSRVTGMQSAGDHKHSLQYATGRTAGVYEWGVGVANHTHQYSFANDMWSAGSHTHTLNTQSTETSANGDHTHTYERVTGIQPASELETRHFHQVDLSHYHPIVYGIFEEQTPTNVTVEVSDDGGATWKTVRTGLNDPVEATIDITDYLSTTEGYKHIRFSSSRRGRLAVMVLLDLHIDNI